MREAAKAEMHDLQHQLTALRTEEMAAAEATVEEAERKA